MRFLLMIYTDETADSTATPEQQQAVMNEYWAFNSAVNQRGVNKGGEALMPTTTATTVRIRDSKATLTDGPFAETKEQLGGYYLLDVKNLDEAIEVAKLCPGAKYGSIELRPILEFGDNTRT